MIYSLRPLDICISPVGASKPRSRGAASFGKSERTLHTNARERASEREGRRAGVQSRARGHGGRASIKKPYLRISASSPRSASRFIAEISGRAISRADRAGPYAYGSVPKRSRRDVVILSSLSFADSPRIVLHFDEGVFLPRRTEKCI